ncbi:hypothetical protein [Streptomyces sp. NPDC086782]|uniref:hypothetical protein n=1 Tax=Streptomyces sp. NPDC086782 TaxID=3365757 RepID=UPI0037F4B9D1
MAHRSDLIPGSAQGVTDEHKNQAAAVLARLAKRYAEEQPGVLVDGFAFTVRVGAEAYDETGRSLNGAHKVVAAVVRRYAPSVEGAACGRFAAGLLDAARALGWSDDDNEPAIPRHPVPGPRRTDESGRVPVPRPEQRAGVAADTVAAALNGAEFTVVAASSYEARMARNVRPLAMTDGRTWMVGAARLGRRSSAPVAWLGAEAAQGVAR